MLGEGSSGHGPSSLLSTGENTGVTKDQDYYFEPVFFEVEGVIFQVPRYQFAESDGIFSTLFTLPQPDAEQEGSSFEKPIRLEGIKVIDFRAFMKVLYPKDIPAKYSLSLAEWISVLKLASQWDFTTIRAFAIDHIRSLPTVDNVTKVILGKEYHVRSWFKEGCVHFVGRHSGPTTEEAEKLGTNIAVRIYQLRERRLQWHGVFDGSLAVEKEFTHELADMDAVLSTESGQ